MWFGLPNFLSKGQVLPHNSGGRSAYSHDLEKGIYVVVLDGIPTGSDDQVFWFSH